MDHLYYGLKNVRNRSSMLELLFLVLKNNSELLLSPEIGQLEVEEVDSTWNAYNSLCTDSRDLTESPLKIMKTDLLNYKLLYLDAQDEFESVLRR